LVEMPGSLTRIDVIVVAMLLGRILNYMKRNGGIKSFGMAVWCGALGGENIPKQKKRTESTET